LLWWVLIRRVASAAASAASALLWVMLLLLLLVVGPLVVMVEGQVVCDILPGCPGKATPKAATASTPSPPALPTAWHGYLAAGR